MAENNSSQVAFPNTSLYVGDLDSDVTEAQLIEKFSTVGNVVLVRVCRDKITRQSLGYAYVNFSQPSEAERALDTLNFDILNSKPMRIMWSQRDPALRRSGVGNVFIKNLDKSIDNKSLYDTFSTFGNIISCKIMSDETGSKGYGFVHFETQEAAEKAINSVNNMLLNGKIVFVGNFLSKQSRSSNPDQTDQKFTNLYVKNFDENFNEEQLKELFSKFGELTSVKIARDINGKSLCFGFVNFSQAENAAKALQELNEIDVNNNIPGTKKLYVSKFQKKNDRLNVLKKVYEEKKLEKLKKYYGINLFVKNLDDKIDDERLKKEFSNFGMITSARVMTDSGRAKGFGFVCYSTAEEATKAVAEMNGRIVGTKPLYVALAQRKEDRRRILTAQFRERMQNSQFMIQNAYNQANPNLYYQLQNQGVNTRFVGNITNQVGNLGSYNIINSNIRPAVPRWSINSNIQRTNLNQNIYAQQQFYATQAGGVRNNLINQQKVVNQNFASVQRSANPQQIFNTKSINPSQQPHRIKAIQVPGQEPLTTDMLSAAQPQEQKQMLGERLFPLIHSMHADWASKITGMLLEIDNAELLHMLDSPESLKAKVEEAVSVLQAHQEKQLQQAQQ